MDYQTRETELRGKFAAGSQEIGDYLDLAYLLYETGRFDAAVDTLKQGLTVPFPEVERAGLLIAQGWYVIGTARDLVGPLELGRRALALTEGIDTVQALVTRASAQVLVAHCVAQTDGQRSVELLSSALAILERVLEEGGVEHPRQLYEVLIDSARLSCGLGRFDEAVRRAEQALRIAPGKGQEIDCLFTMGISYRGAGRLVESREALARATDFPDRHPSTFVRLYYHLGLTERAMGKAAEARAKARRAIEILNEDPTIPRTEMAELLRLNADLSYEIGDWEEAVRSFAAAVDCYAPTDARHWNPMTWLAHCQYHVGQVEAARKNAELVKQSPLAQEGDHLCAEALLEVIRKTN